MNVNRSISFVAGVGLGAGLIYFTVADGRRHRAVIRDKFQHWNKKMARALDVGFRDFFNRSQGIFARTISGILPEWDLDDATLEARIKSETGRFLSHPKAVQVISNRRNITLRGPIPLVEFDRFHEAVCRVKGVRNVNSELELVLNPELHPALQGPSKSTKKISVLERSMKTPSVKLLASGAGVGLLGAGITAFLNRRREKELHDPGSPHADDLQQPRSGYRVEKEKAPAPRNIYPDLSPGLPH